MPTTSVIQCFNALLKVLQGNSLEDSRDGVAHPRIDLSIAENCRSLYEERLEHMVLGDCVKDGEMLGAEVYDGHWISVVACDPPSQTELGRIVHCQFEGRDGSTRQE
jgi:hypothetical protein